MCRQRDALCAAYHAALSGSQQLTAHMQTSARQLPGPVPQGTWLRAL